MKFVLAIDPGYSGYFCLTNGRAAKFWPMPVDKIGTVKTISYDGVVSILRDCKKIGGRDTQVFLERAVAFRMGVTSAFNYGAGFAVIQIAIHAEWMSFILVDPRRWAKTMHQGIKKDLKAKEKSQIAVRRLFPRLLKFLPKKGKGFHDGAVDALLIGGYALREAKEEPWFKGL